LDHLLPPLSHQSLLSTDAADGLLLASAAGEASYLRDTQGEHRLPPATGFRPQDLLGWRQVTAWAPRLAEVGSQMRLKVGV
jgi:hypothetical protein